MTQAAGNAAERDRFFEASLDRDLARQSSTVLHVSTFGLTPGKPDLSISYIRCKIASARDAAIGSLDFAHACKTEEKENTSGNIALQ